MADQLPAREQPTPEGLTAKWHPAELQQQETWQTTLPNETPEERRRVLALIEGECLAAEDVMGAGFPLQGYIVHPVNLTNEDTGEVVQAIRTLLLAPEGPPVACVSIGILQSLARIAHAERRNPPFDPPIVVAIKQVRGKGGRRIYKLVPVVE